MVNDKELAESIARGVFAALDSGLRKCWRIQGKAMGQDKKEINLGGFGEAPLADHIEKLLSEHRSY